LRRSVGPLKPAGEDRHGLFVNWLMAALLQVVAGDGGITLAADKARFVDYGRPTELDAVTNLVPVNGALVGTFAFKRGPGNGADEAKASRVLRFDPAGGSWAPEHETTGNLYAAAVSKGVLTTAAWRTDRGGPPRTWDGKSWSETKERPGLLFIYSLAAWDGALYAGGAVGC
jgi:hypothetical protein